MFKLSFPEVFREYRPELNGLRAVAVLLVLFFHLDFEWMKGGFLGVDVFLVISGYFISRNLIYELQNEKFTFYGFYTKRLRRLFPALIVTLSLVLIAGYFILPPVNYERLGESTLFSAVSLSNFFFWSEAGYFNLDAATKPLLHMWSLSLEEQFYLFWPLLLFLIYKYLRKYTIVMVGILIVISVGLGEFYFSQSPEAVFFLIPFRMFEFLLGASCIWLERFSHKIPKLSSELLFIIGFLLIIVSAVVFDHTTPMPGLLSMIPCGGAVLIILNGKVDFSSWSLKNVPMELIGKASYSIYLVHWPLVVYYKYQSLTDLSLTTQLILAAISLILGFMMWYFIENTFRYVKDKNAKLDRIWIGVPISILVLVAVSTMIWKSDGFSDRVTDKQFLNKEEILANRERYFDKYRKGDSLFAGKEEVGHVMIMGNSHSIDLIYMLRLNGFEAQITALNTLGKCYNFGQSYPEEEADWCTKKRIENLKNKDWKLVDAVYLHDNWPQWEARGFREMIRTIRSLTPAPIYVFGPKMTYKKDIPDIVYASESTNPKEVNDFARKFQRLVTKEEINEALHEEFEDRYYDDNDIHFIDMLVMQGGKDLDSFEIVSSDNLDFLYFDTNHFTEVGAKKMGAKIKEVHPEIFTPK
jgi:peptidoglycan/LPS O-acetylase OafA/YrhL